jgi:hypothetical protein
MNRILPALLLLCFMISCCYSYAQQEELYWKNRKPHAGYWQQDVHYIIKAHIDESTHQLAASQELIYTNNSPDTLYFVYFHLFQNAFIKGSYTHELELANKVKPRLGRYEAAGLGTLVHHIKVDGLEVATELDNTILKVLLPKPLLPGGQVTFSMQFTSFFDRGSTRRRMQLYDAWGFPHYNGCQWFPKICVYDAKFGWDTHQHLGKEFYGDFGTYDVTLDFASNYIVEATGVLQNRKEVLPDELREKLDIKNFAQKPWGEKPSTIIPYKKAERKQWHFIAHHVHDFAFTADPSYRIGTVYQDGVECVAIVQEPHAAGWQNAAELVAEIIKTFSAQYGTYHYPKMVAADANDGMEYPMITMDGGREPGYRGLLVHEIGHNWYYGMVGSNETYRAALDEGFTQFLTAEGLRMIDGDTLVEAAPSSKWKKMFNEKKLTKDVRVYNAYIWDAATGNDHQLNTHSDDFGGALGHGGGYRHVYYKTAAMLYNLQYVLGDSLFDAAMLHYFHQWKFAHPYFEDFRNSIIQFTHVDLNWFFDQWLETTKSIDYGIKRIRKAKSAKDSVDITFVRKGSMQMPLDFTIVDKTGTSSSFHIPNNWFEKHTDATILPRWIGWGKLNKQHTVRVPAINGVKRVIIDTTYRLADKMMLDNSRTNGLFHCLDNVQFNLDAGLNTPFDWKKYRMTARPDLWYNAIDGVKIGLHFDGAYMHKFLRMEAAIWYNTQLGQSGLYQKSAVEESNAAYPRFNFYLNLESPIARNYPNITGYLKARFLDGLAYHIAGLNWQVTERDQIGLSVRSQERRGHNIDYLLYPMEWSSNQHARNSSIQVDFDHNYNYHKGVGRIELTGRAPFLTDAFNYSYVQATVVNENFVGKLLLRSRLVARLGAGNNVPSESALYLSGANAEEMMENKYVRSRAFVPNDWIGQYSASSMGHFHYGGGLNLRGYTGYLAPEIIDGDYSVAYKGRSGMALNFEADFTNYIRFQPSFTKRWLRVNLYAFADAGLMELSYLKGLSAGKPAMNILPTNNVSDIRFDAGLGAAVTIKKWGVLEKAKPLTLRFDMPFFVSKPAPDQSSYIAPRWIVGVGRAF